MNNNQTENKMSVVEHLEELRRRIILSCLIIIVLWGLSYYFIEDIFKLLFFPISKTINQLYFFSPVEAFLVRLKVSLFFGIYISLPFILDQFRRFVIPAVEKEKRKILSVFPILVFLIFGVGASFGLFVVMPVALKFLLGFKTETLLPLISLERYLSFVLIFLVGFGLVFQWPVFVYILSKLNIISTEFLRTKRKFAIVGIFILAAVLTPGPDIFSQFLLAIPCIILYELGIIICGTASQ